MWNPKHTHLQYNTIGNYLFFINTLKLYIWLLEDCINSVGQRLVCGLNDLTYLSVFELLVRIVKETTAIIVCIAKCDCTVLCDNYQFHTSYGSTFLDSPKNTNFSRSFR